jgi:SPP1 gp7 family putative phage head morphogenesis protein
VRDPAHALADKELEEIEKRIEEIYKRANKEIEEKARKYFKRFAELDKEKRALVESGKMTEKAYTEWRKGKIMTGKRWESLKKQTAEAMNNANNIAADYVNGRVPSVYAINYNQVSKDLTGQVRGISFEMVDAHTVKNLATQDKTLLPYKTVNGVKDVRWNTQKVNSEILQGILQGDSVADLSKRLRKVTAMNEASAVRNARTAVTSAENKGRMDMLSDAEDKGVQAKKVWMATNDSRTRDAHLELDGQEAWKDEPFENEFGKIMFPGDPDAAPENVYNCRCKLGYHVIGFWNR